MKSSQKNRFREFHKQTREVLFDAIASEMYPVNTEYDGEIAYLLVHLCSGRGALPHAVETFQSIKPAEWRPAEETFSSYDFATASPEFFALVGGVTCGEIINEALEEHYDWALMLANGAADRFKGTFIEPEVLRCRGIVLLALNHLSAAIGDLERAVATTPGIRSRVDANPKGRRHSQRLTPLTNEGRLFQSVASELAAADTFSKILRAS